MRSIRVWIVVSTLIGLVVALIASGCAPKPKVLTAQHLLDKIGAVPDEEIEVGQMELIEVSQADIDRLIYLAKRKVALLREDKLFAACAQDYQDMMLFLRDAERRNALPLKGKDLEAFNFNFFPATPHFEELEWYTEFKACWRAYATGTEIADPIQNQEDLMGDIKGKPVAEVDLIGLQVLEKLRGEIDQYLAEVNEDIKEHNHKMSTQQSGYFGKLTR